MVSAGLLENLFRGPLGWWHFFLYTLCMNTFTFVLLQKTSWLSWRFILGVDGIFLVTRESVFFPFSLGYKEGSVFLCLVVFIYIPLNYISFVFLILDWGRDGI